MEDSEVVSVSLTDLSEDEKIKNLVPEMTTDEWNKFLESCRVNGIRQPIDVRKDGVILDGRHRYRAAKVLKIASLKAIFHGFDEAESIRFVTITAIDRRNLTDEQRVDIAFRSKKLLADIATASKKSQGSRTDLTSESIDPEVKTKYTHTNEALGKIAHVSEVKVRRMKKIKKEDPDAYKRVVEGRQNVWNAYTKLPTVSFNKSYRTKSAPPIAANSNERLPNGKTDIDGVVEACTSPVIDLINTVDTLNELFGKDNVAKAIELIPQKYPDLSRRAIEALKFLKLN